MTTRTLNAFRGKTLVLPDVRVLDEKEVATIHRFAARGGRVVIDGASNSGLGDLDGAVRLQDDPAKVYLANAERDLASARPDEQTTFLQAVGSAGDTAVQVHAAKDVVAHAMQIRGKTYLFVSNFTGIKPGVELTPTTQTDVSVTVPISLGSTMHVLPFLGTETVVYGTRAGERESFAVPALDRGMVAWFR